MSLKDPTDATDVLIWIQIAAISYALIRRLTRATRRTR